MFLTKIQPPFILKILKKLVIEESYLIIMKAIYDKSTANIVLTGERFRACLLQLGTR